MSEFDNPSFSESLALATEQSLMIGTIDEIQKLHIRTIPLGEGPRRICHQEQTNTFLVLTTKVVVDKNGDENEVGFIKLVHSETFEILDSYNLQFQEIAFSLESCLFTDDPAPYYVVGTSYVIPLDAEPTKVGNISS
eukprot:TRINITY_DN7167_c0_g2_i1.p1 TRINITY_DN7167_c0_g2~~TRINITY_DN7167_c0_g2_i1.p1  ORF type:complete len:137 (+),score=18.61 TRINITY_DN7167_c0_g2_i1:106-516(+)